MPLLFVYWNPDVVAFCVGNFDIRWYSLCWVAGLLAVYVLEQRLYREQRVPDETFEPLFFYCFVGILVGARLGHCLFYEPSYYLSSLQGVAEMVLPVRWDRQGTLHFTGYEGLASHGGTLGLIVALVVFTRRQRLRLAWVLDNIAIVTPVCACAIRIGNLMNSEIIGRPTAVPWAFVFGRVDTLPRHPAQLYEALAYAATFAVGWAVYRRLPQRVGSGFFFGLCLLLIFSARIGIELVKENQVGFEEGMTLNMGQLLSLPFVALGAWCMWRGCRKGK